MLIEYFIDYGPRVLGAIALLFFGFSVIKWILSFVDKLLNKQDFDPSMQSFVKAVCSFTLKVVLLITFASLIGIPMTTFIAILGAAGLAIGFALRDSLANFAGGILIMSFRPFGVGDFIEAQGQMGTVKEIQLLYTHINTPDNKRVVLPNGDLANSQVVNFSTEDTRRVDLVFGIGYESDVLKAKEILTRLATTHPLGLKDPEPLIRVSEHGDSAINFNVRLWCDSANYWAIYYDLHEQVLLEFQKEDISIPFPQMDVHVHQDR